MAVIVRSAGNSFADYEPVAIVACRVAGISSAHHVQPVFVL